jgi:hypothetical protein
MEYIQRSDLISEALRIWKDRGYDDDGWLHCRDLEFRAIGYFSNPKRCTKCGSPRAQLQDAAMGLIFSLSLALGNGFSQTGPQIKCAKIKLQEKFYYG